MELQSISQISKNYGISAQTLRYYEQIGLIKSIRNENNAYRFYDEEVVKQLHSIIILRKLRIPVKQIKEILNNKNALTTIEIFERNISELDEEITSLSTIKSILARFAEELRANTDMVLKFDLLDDENTLTVLDSITFSKNYLNNLKEDLSIEDLNKANKTLENLEEKKSNETIGPSEEQTKNNPPVLNKFECVVEKCGPYRFIGKAVYVRNDWRNPHSATGEIVQGIWKAKDWIFKTLDKMTEYITDMPYGGGLYMWDKYEEKSQLTGYIIGKFMKDDTPVPDGMDYFDIPEGYIAKGWGGYVEGEVKEMLKNSDEYNDASWFWGGEVFDDFKSLGNGVNVDNLSGYFISCTLK